MFIQEMGGWFSWLIMVLALYSLSSLTVVTVRRLVRPLARKEQPIQYLVMTSESGQHLEYLLRRIDWEARLLGRDYRILWRDEGSLDETVRIMERFQQQKELLPPLNAMHHVSEFNQASELNRPADCAPLLRREVVLLDLRKSEAQVSPRDGEM